MLLHKLTVKNTPMALFDATTPAPACIQFGKEFVENGTIRDALQESNNTVRELPWSYLLPQAPHPISGLAFGIAVLYLTAAL
jgi:hypothetical protein